MSGPVAAEDVDESASVGVSAPPEVEIMQSRSTQVGSIPVRRALPQRGRRTVGAWCFLDHGGPVDAALGEMGIGPHPHIGLQTVTWLLAGELLHRDSLGSEQPILPGQLNLMTAGHGVVHAEEQTAAGIVHVVQLWVAQPDATRNEPASFEHHAELPQIDLGRGSVATVLVGVIGDATSPARRDTEHLGAELFLRSDVALPAESRYEYALVGLEGLVEIEGRQVGTGKLAYLGLGRDEIRLGASGGARAMLLGGAPFDEPLLMWWNYVARTRDEIARAHSDWSSRSPRFVVPDSVLPPIDADPPLWPVPGG